MNPVDKKILILTSSTGGGHDSAAAALNTALEKNGAQCEVRNFLDFTPKAKKTVLSKGHVFIYRHAPLLYALGYRFEEVFPENLYANYARYAHPIKRYILNGGYDVVVCVHIFPMLMLTAAQKKYGYDVPTYFISTDYTCSPGAGQMNPKMLFIPPGCRKEFERSYAGRTVPPIAETGIPVAEAFREKVSKEEARRKLIESAKEKHDLGKSSFFSLLEAERKLVMVSAGSMGCGPLKKISEELAKMRPDVTVAVFTGNNKKLYRQLEARNRETGNLMPLGFTKEMPLWMHAADLMISKPGGLTSTEAATAGLPLLLFDEVPGLETHNMAYFVKRGCAVREKTAERLIRRASLMLDNEEELAGIRKQQKKLFPGTAADVITSLLF